MAGKEAYTKNFCFGASSLFKAVLIASGPAGNVLDAHLKLLNGLHSVNVHPRGRVTEPLGAAELWLTLGTQSIGSHGWNKRCLPVFFLFLPRRCWSRAREASQASGPATVPSSWVPGQETVFLAHFQPGLDLHAPSVAYRAI